MSVVFELSMKRLMKQKLVLALMSLFPFVVLILPVPTGAKAPTLGYGMFGLVVMFSAFLLSKQVIEDRQMKTVVRIAAAPIKHRDYLLGHLTAYFTVLFVQILIFWTLSIVRWEATSMYFVWGLPYLLVFMVMGVTFSLFWHTFFKTYATSIAIFSIAVNVMALVGGMTFPLSIMPDSMRRVAVAMPTYWFSYGLEFVVDENTVGAIICLFIMTGFAIIFLLIGSRRRLE